MTITMNETQAQRDAERIREHAPKLLERLAAITDAMDCMGDLPDREICPYVWKDLDCERLISEARQAIEYATGAHDPGCYPEAGYEVDAAGTATGRSA